MAKIHDGCTCYVRHIPQEVTFGLHAGVHNKQCPCYRPSHDPVDYINDAEFREGWEAIVLDDPSIPASAFYLQWE